MTSIENALNALTYAVLAVALAPFAWRGVCFALTVDEDDEGRSLGGLLLYLLALLPAVAFLMCVALAVDGTYQ